MEEMAEKMYEDHQKEKDELEQQKTQLEKQL